MLEVQIISFTLADRWPEFCCEPKQTVSNCNWQKWYLDIVKHFLYLFTKSLAPSRPNRYCFRFNGVHNAIPLGYVTSLRLG